MSSTDQPDTQNQPTPQPPATPTPAPAPAAASAKTQEQLAQEHADDQDAVQRAVDEWSLYGVSLEGFKTQTREQLEAQYPPHAMKRIDAVAAKAGFTVGQDAPEPEPPGEV